MVEIVTRQNKSEELANSITHGVGLVLSLIGWVVLMGLAYLEGDVWQLVSCGVYGGTLVFLYAVSTSYHAVQTPRYKRILRILDHIAIFLLIAGTYTPFTMVFLRDGWGWTLLALVWGIAAIGLLFKVFSRRRFHWGATVLYLAMGWLSIIFIDPVLSAVPVGALLWLLAGGLAYTLGVVFFGWNALPFNHSIWHVFVLAGSAAHYFAVLFYVIS